MQRIAILFLLLTALIFGQNKYFLPIKIEQSNGRPINNANVDLYTAGTSTKVYDLTYLSNSAGAYYQTSTFTTGFYDIYVNGRSWKTYVYINSSNQNTSTIALTTIQAADTVSLKLMTAYGDTATYRYLQKFSDSKLNGAGFFIQGDSSQMMSKFGTATADGGAIFANAGTAKRWYREELDRGEIYADWYGNTHTALTSAIALANITKFPVFVNQTITVSDSITLNDSVQVIFKGGAGLTRGAAYTGDLFTAAEALTDITFEGGYWNMKGLSGYGYNTTAEVDNFKFLNTVVDSMGAVLWRFNGEAARKNNIEISGNEFYHKDADSTSINAIVIAETDNFRIEGNKFYRCGVKLEGDKFNFFVNNNLFEEIFDATTISARVLNRDTLRNFEIIGNTFKNNGWYGASKPCIGIGNDQSDDTSYVSNGVINNNKAYASYQLLNLQGTFCRGDNITIADNVFDGRKEADSIAYTKNLHGDSLRGVKGIWISGSTDAMTPGIMFKNINIHDNQIMHSKEAAITVRVFNSKVHSNIIMNAGADTTNITTPNELSGIDILGSRNLEVYGNQVSYCDKQDISSGFEGAGIYVDESGSDSVWIHHNYCFQNYYGINVAENAGDTQVPVNIKVTNNWLLNNTVDLIDANRTGNTLSSLSITPTDTNATYPQETNLYKDNIFTVDYIDATSDRAVNYYDTGRIFTNQNAAGAVQALAKTAILGYNFIVLKLTAQTFKVNPQATDSITVNGAADGNLIIDNVGDWIHFRCNTVNRWDIEKHFLLADTLNFE